MAQYEKVFSKSKASICTVITDEMIGTGFVVGDGTIVVTNRHVIEDASEIDVSFPNINVTGVALPAGEEDLALLRLSRAATKSPLKLRAQPASVGEQCLVIGSPRGLELTLSLGIISSVRKIAGLSLLQHTAAISRGSSGSPILDKKGAVLGVVSSSIESGQSLNFAVNGGHLKNLLSAPKWMTVASYVGVNNFSTSASMDIQIRAISRLVKKLKGQDEDESQAAFEQITSKGPKIIPALLAYLEKETEGFPDYDEYALQILQLFGASAKPHVLKGMNGESKMKRLVSVSALQSAAEYWKNQDPEEAEELGWPDPKTCTWVNETESRTALLKACSDAIPFIRSRAILTCGTLGITEAIPAAGKFLSTPDKEIGTVSFYKPHTLKSLAFETLIRLSATSSENDIQKHFQTLVDRGDDYGHISAFLVLEDVRNEIAFDLAKSACTHKSDSVRASAIHCLRFWPRPEVATLAREMVKDKDIVVKGYAVTTLGAAGKDEAVDELVAMIESKDEDYFDSAVEGLGLTGSKRALDMLYQVLEGKYGDPEFKEFNIIYAINALRKLGFPEAIPKIKPFLKSDDSLVSGAAKTAIESLEKPKKKEE